MKKTDKLIPKLIFLYLNDFEHYLKNHEQHFF